MLMCINKLRNVSEGLECYYAWSFVVLGSSKVILQRKEGRGREESNIIYLQLFLSYIESFSLY